MKASEILKVKGDILYTVTPDSSLRQALDTMVDKDIGSLVVMEYGELAGMLTFREVIQAIDANGGQVGAGTVRSTWTTSDPITPGNRSQRSAPHDAGRHARYMPVMNGAS